MENEPMNGMNVRQFLQLFLSKIWIILISMVLGGAMLFAYAKFVMPLKYESYTSLYVRSRESDEGDSTNIKLSDLNTSKSLVSTYIVVLDSDSAMQSVADILVSETDLETLQNAFNVTDGRIKAADVRKCFRMSAVEDTEVMKITANTKDPEVSAALCNIMGRIAPDFLIRVVGAGSVEVIDVAVPRYAPVSPNVGSFTFRGLLLGLVLSCVVIFLIDFFDNTVKDSQELYRLYKKSMLGEIQNVTDPGSDKRKKNKKKSSTDEERMLILDKRVPFNVVESYKSIRTNVIFSLGTSDNNMIAISSANPSEGKSTSAANIAIAFAQTGCRVLLIDADMRKPMLHKIFKTSNKAGLSTMIINLSTAEESIKSGVVKNLDLLSSGPMPPNPSELLSSRQFSDLLDQLSQRYDYIIIDTPPINVVSDALIISGLVSGTILVLKYANTTYDDVSESMKQIEMADVNLLGFILNDVQKEHSGNYYKYRYRYHYKYKNYGYDYGYGYGYGRRFSSDEEPEESADQVDEKPAEEADSDSEA